MNESEESEWRGYGFGDIGVVWSEDKKRERQRERYEMEVKLEFCGRESV